jgi:putative peptidoglycan lipid II flippase
MKLGKHIFSVGAWTGVSRILGFVRDMLIGRFMGAGRMSDIFLAAFKLPNLFRDLLGEGAMSAVFIPMFSGVKSDRRAAEKFASNAFSWLMAVLLFITITVEILMPLVMLLFAPGFDPAKLDLTVKIARIMFFYVILVCGVGFLSSMMNAFSKFAIAAAVPVLLNVFLIGGLLVAWRFGFNMLYTLAVSVLIAGIVQFAILFIRIRHHNFGLRLVLPKWSPMIKTMGRRMGVGLFASGFYQLNILVGMLIASYQNGAVSWLYYSDRMVQLPFAIIGLAAGTVLLTSISDAISNKNMRSVYIQQNSSMRRSMLFTIPCMVGLIVLAEPIIRCLFEYGAWTHESTLMVAAAIMIQALVLPAMVTSQIFTKTLYAAQDVKTPVKLSMISMGVGIVIMLTLVWFVGYLAMPIATVIGGYLRNWLLRRECEGRGLYKTDPRTRRQIIAFLLVSVILGALAWFVPVPHLIALGAVIAGFGILYLPAAFLIAKKI